ncbi:MAG: zf-HC2 domain-containing protein [Spirochaetes bacterium]|nr:zf-HC2 domain-containing protein [Spirochaetota bacterium]
MKCKDIRSFIVEEITGEITPENKKILLDHITTCPECAKVMREISPIHAVTEKYFKGVKVPYNEKIEEKITESLFRRKIQKRSAIVENIKQLFLRSRALRPALVTVSAVLIILGTIFYNTYTNRKKIAETISSIVAIRSNTVDFILFNNMDDLVSLYIQKNQDLTFMDEDELLSQIKYTLSLYLNTQLNAEFISENSSIVNDLIDEYSQKHLNFLKENYDKILI